MLEIMVRKYLQLLMKLNKMSRLVVHPLKSFAAQITNVRSFPSVNAHVNFQLRRPDEFPLAHFTLVKLCSWV